MDEPALFEVKDGPEFCFGDFYVTNEEEIELLDRGFSYMTAFGSDSFSMTSDKRISFGFYSEDECVQCGRRVGKDVMSFCLIDDNENVSGKVHKDCAPRFHDFLSYLIDNQEDYLEYFL
jgi:hypothetical protein